MSDSRPVGVFDSGVGGLSVLREIRALLPGENLLYCADSGHAPYGEKPQALIEARSLEICDFLLDQGAKALVIACNTATAAAANAIRARWPWLPVIGVEPAVKPATAATHKGVVGVLATTGTLESARFAALLDRFGHGVQVITQPGTGLVDLIEQGEFDGPRLRGLLTQHLAPMREAGADTVVLGCTHYIFLRPLIAELLGPAVALIDTGAAVARQLQRQLEAADLTAAVEQGGERFFCSGDVGRVAAAIRVLWGPAAAPEPLPPSCCFATSKQP
ncbi:MAG: glutamate racemase [Candidatus Dactylopiibacterium carminicum]|uniref:Glutamate racemase n=1 Tax=Candidatus Dactylopiibacterium carminicum TaxID=857335 RepID=A0A272ET02_9RHOO|nr:glutamate racemase [Candidatus Dactylopiibacterium carminicum]KAF7599194.1 glutamate racemase [Candidatus Dactylopiibacterium carminicum]PAS93235.1 MAG: glutamate racemase [Candidatus Dactylopiibacterium carminicum]PAS97130.1 MAG: glutamate racemase [Candidatus Dactylopiibacterium carminicum]PAS99205.1 MAG: glutamate racemase [Candidatus Dactylopiibacterium carminicum]